MKVCREINIGFVPKVPIYMRKSESCQWKLCYHKLKNTSFVDWPYRISQWLLKTMQTLSNCSFSLPHLTRSVIHLIDWLTILRHFIFDISSQFKRMRKKIGIFANKLCVPKLLKHWNSHAWTWVPDTTSTSYRTLGDLSVVIRVSNRHLNWNTIVM